MDIETVLHARELIRLRARADWRIKRYGAVMLSPREYLALRHEQDIMHERRLEYRRIQAAAETHMQATIAQDKRDGTYAARRGIAGYYEAVRNQYIADRHAREERVTKAEIGRRMGCTRQNVDSLLASATAIMAYFEMVGIEARWRWDAEKARWWLDAPVSLFSRSRYEISA